MDQGNEVVLAAIRQCEVSSTHRKLDIHYYTRAGPIDVVDISTVQALVGRVKDIERWAIVDRSGSLARAEFCIDEE